MTLPESKLGDCGRRYEIRCQDDDGAEHVIGWSDDPEAFRQAIELHPGHSNRTVVERSFIERLRMHADWLDSRGFFNESGTAAILSGNLDRDAAKELTRLQAVEAAVDRSTEYDIAPCLGCGEDCIGVAGDLNVCSEVCAKKVSGSADG